MWSYRSIALASALGLSAPAPLLAGEAVEGGTLKGEVVNRRNKQPIEGVVVSAEGHGAALGDARGRFELKHLPPGEHIITVVAPGYLTERMQISLGPEAETFIRLMVDPQAGTSGGDVIVIEGEAEYADPVVQVISVPELQRIPGAFGDAVRGVQNLPGVARSSFGTGALIVRGTEPQDTGVYIDGIRVPQLFHFGGLTTVINSDVLEEVRFLPGGYGVRYGRNLGGVVEVATNDSIPQGPSGYADIDLFDTTLYVQTPLGEYGGMRASVRRSYVDVVLGAFLDNAPMGRGGSLQLPVYDDYQLVYDTALGDDHRLHVLVFGARDRFSIEGIGVDPSTDPLITEGGDAELKITNHKGMAKWTWSPSSSLTQRLTVGFGPDSNQFSVGDLRLSNAPFSVYLRDDVYYEPAATLRLRGGLDGVGQLYRFDLSIPGGTGTSDDPLAEPESVVLAEAPYVLSVAPWVEADKVLGSLTLTPGLRMDHHRIWNEGLLGAITSFDPRIAGRWRLGPDLSLKGSVGRFSNGVDPFAAFGEVNPDEELNIEYAIQSTLGVDYRIRPGLSLSGSVYESELRDLLVSAQGQGGAMGGGPSMGFLSTGAGANYGLEALLRRDVTDSGFFGWVSYTLQYNLRNDDFDAACPRFDSLGEGEAGCSPWYLFESDQTHILTVVASQELGNNWELGLRFRYTTGNPTTPVIDAVFDVDSDGWTPIYGEANSERVPAFNQLDLRVDKRWYPKWGTVAASLEVMNVYNRANPESISYSQDYSESGVVSGIPFFPSFGFKAEF